MTVPSSLISVEMAEAAKLTALVPVADGSEEIETVCIVDTFVLKCDAR